MQPIRRIEEDARWILSTDGCWPTDSTPIPAADSRASELFGQHLEPGCWIIAHQEALTAFTDMRQSAFDATTILTFFLQSPVTNDPRAIPIAPPPTDPAADAPRPPRRHRHVIVGRIALDPFAQLRLMLHQPRMNRVHIGLEYRHHGLFDQSIRIGLHAPPEIDDMRFKLIQSCHSMRMWAIEEHRSRTQERLDVVSDIAQSRPHHGCHLTFAAVVNDRRFHDLISRCPGLTHNKFPQVCFTTASSGISPTFRIHI